MARFQGASCCETLVGRGGGTEAAAARGSHDVGTRTWGGLIGLSGNPRLIDGGAVQVPTFRMYDVRGEWFPEGRRGGTDAQLDRAIEEAMRPLREGPWVPPERPGPEDRSAKGRTLANGR